MIRYHDMEWGVPCFDDRKQFEFLILESAQAGLSWRTVLHKRENYRRAFAGFDPERVARFDQAKVRALLGDAGIIRNRLKIEAAVSNARAFLDLREQCGSFSSYLWGFVGGRPVVRRRRSLKDLPATTPLSDALSKDLKRRGFKFLGSTVVYSHLQALGLVNDHTTGCFRRAEILAASRAGRGAFLL
jgi:DNA-3-methyladenine glycosylase I